MLGEVVFKERVGIRDCAPSVGENGEGEAKRGREMCISKVGRDTWIPCLSPAGWKAAFISHRLAALLRPLAMTIVRPH